MLTGSHPAYCAPWGFTFHTTAYWSSLKTPCPHVVAVVKDVHVVVFFPPSKPPHSSVLTTLCVSAGP